MSNSQRVMNEYRDWKRQYFNSDSRPVVQPIPGKAIFYDPDDRYRSTQLDREWLAQSDD